MRDVIRGFREFIARGNIIDLAVAVVVGTAFTAVVNSLVKDLLTPFIAAIFGKTDFSSLTFTLHGSTFTYGSFINALITFISVSAAVYLFVVLPINKLNDRRKRGVSNPEDEPPPSQEAVLLAEIRDLLATTGGHEAGGGTPGKGNGPIPEVSGGPSLSGSGGPPVSR